MLKSINSDKKNIDMKKLQENIKKGVILLKVDDLRLDISKWNADKSD